MKVAIIPARGGSKRIPRKNIRRFCGKPMIAWAIEIAKESDIFDEIVVSTDDNEIAKIAEECGASVPFKRPSSLSDDHTTMVPVVAHAINRCERLGWNISFVCCIYPCVPFLEPGDILAAYNSIRASSFEFVYPVTEYSHPTQRAMRRLDSGKMEFIFPCNETRRTQDLESTFHDAGQFYWGKASAWKKTKKMHSNGLGTVIPNWRVIDIDNLDDWKRAELLHKVMKFD